MACKAVYVGSNPTAVSSQPVAQRLEYEFWELGVVGSNPTRLTNFPLTAARLGEKIPRAKNLQPLRLPARQLRPLFLSRRAA